MYYFFLVSFLILGAGIKVVDDAFDEKTFSKKVAYFLAPFLGVLWAYTMVIHPVSGTILLAILCGVLFKGKIDNIAHLSGLLVIIPVIFLAGVELMLIPLVILAAAAFIDEVGNDFFDKRKNVIKNSLVRDFVTRFFDHRWMMKIMILGLAILGVIPLYFFVAMFLFDYAYLAVRWYSGFKQNKISTSLDLGLSKGEAELN